MSVSTMNVRKGERLCALSVIDVLVGATFKWAASLWIHNPQPN